MNRVLAGLASFVLAIGFARAAVDANTASRSELESISGIGPATSARIVQERASKPFRDTRDLMRRVKGIGEAKLRRMVDAGLTVSGNGVLVTAGGDRQPVGGPGGTADVQVCVGRGSGDERPAAKAPGERRPR